MRQLLSSPVDVVEVPEAGWLAWWTHALLHNATSGDEALAALYAGDLGDLRVSWDGEALDLWSWWARLRHVGINDFLVALPRPGSMPGLAGPSSFNTNAIAAGQCLIAPGARLGWTPDGDMWHTSTANAPAYVDDLAAADRNLREASRRTVALVAENSDVWADLVDDLLNPRPGELRDVPASVPDAAVRLCEQAMTWVRILDGLRSRTSLPPEMRHLDEAARSAMAAAFSSAAWPR